MGMEFTKYPQNLRVFELNKLIFLTWKKVKQSPRSLESSSGIIKAWIRSKNLSMSY